MLLIEIENEIKPLSRREKEELFTFLAEELADPDEDALDAALVDARRSEPVFSLAECLNDRKRGKIPV